MIKLIDGFGGKEYILLFLLLITIFFITISLIKSRRVRLIVSIFAGLFTSAQLVSLYFTQSFIGYQLYIHANLRGITGMHNLFIYQIIILFVIFITLTFAYFFSHPIITKLIPFQAIKTNQLFFYFRIICLVIFSSIFLLQGTFLDDSKSLQSIFATSNEIKFKEVLKKYSMESYITPNEIESSPGKNIIIISMESIERAFLENKYSDLTPNLNLLKSKWNYFDMNQNEGSSWTSGSLYTYLTGFPAFFGLESNSIFQNASYSDISSISHVLKKANYNNIYLNGNTDNSGVKDMLNIFMFDKIIDHRNSINTGYESTYGLRDKDLFSIAKNEILIQKELKNRFALFISTTDTHFPNGIYDERMESLISKKNSDLEFMVASLDYLIGDFISFLNDQNILDNTTIFIFPDHLKMGNPYMFENTGERGLYVITNSNNLKLDSTEIFQIDLPKIILDGSNVKHNLKFLSDYIKGDKIKFLDSNIIALTEINQAGITNSSFTKYENINVSEKYDDYIKDTLRFIAHAGGKIDNYIYTNSLEALNNSYANGFRLFELDIIETNDGHFVAAHDWEQWADMVNYSGELPVSRDFFMSKKIFQKYTPLDMETINQWFYIHKDAVLITDKINMPTKFSKVFVDKERLMMELFDKKALKEGLSLGILSAIPSQSIVDNLKIKDVKKLADKGVKHIAISRRFINGNKELLNEFKKHNIKPYAYHINFDAGIDEEYMVKYEMDYIYGIYADEWNFE